MFCPDSPAPDIPDSSPFSYTKGTPGKLPRIYLDVANIFHNIPLPLPLWHIFPLPTVLFGDIPASTRDSILPQLNLSHLPLDTFLRPALSTVPMGFTSSVIIAHVLVSSIVQSEFHISLQLPAFRPRPRF